jgi:uncharacterized protein YdhG (YjbR/CyaY superfamily)
MSEKGAKGDSVAAVDAYLASVAEPARSTLLAVRAMIRAAAPAEATEGMSYGMPAFRYKGALVSYAAFKNHCSFFPMSAATLDALQDESGQYRTSKGTLQFAPDEPLPEALVEKVVRLRVLENERRKNSK